MKSVKISIGTLFLMFVLFSACQKSSTETAAVSEFTGNQSTYALQAASQYPISGTVTFKERKDGATSIIISLTGVTDSDQHPVHLHLGDMSTDGANIAALLSPVAGKDGLSTTIISKLADETSVTYASLTKLNACVKVHLGSVGAEADIILAAGNVGASSTTSNGRATIGVCKSI